MLVIIALVTVITGGDVLFFVLLAVSLLGMTELYKVFGIEKKPPGTVGYLPRSLTTRFCIFSNTFRARN